MKQLSSSGLEFLKKEENRQLFDLEIANKDTSSALKTKVFNLSGKKFVVFGYGTTSLAFPELHKYTLNNAVFTILQANTYLKKFVDKIGASLRSSGKFDTSQAIDDSQYDALISLAYSSGGESFFTRPENQTFIALVKDTLQKNNDSAKKLHKLWPFFKIKDSSGATLSARRIRERDLFFKSYDKAVINEQSIGEIDSIDEKPIAEKIKGFFEYIHYDSSLKTVDEIIKNQRWIDPDQVKANDSNLISATKLLDLPNFNNRALVRDKYDSQQFDEIIEGQEENLIVVGTILMVPFNCVGLSRISSVGNSFFQTETNTAEFIYDSMSKLIDSNVNGFFKDREISYSGEFLNSQKGFDTLLKIYPRLTVWMYCKSLGSEITNAPLYASDGAIVNLTPFIQSLKTTQGATGGSWSLQIQPISCECSNEGWRLNRVSFAEFLHNKENNFVESVRAQYPEGKHTKRTNFLFHNLITANDIIFIKFDDINQAGDTRKVSKSFEFNVENTQLPNQQYDMIGLVDINSCSVNQKSASVSISIAGRDMMKLLIEDGSYWLNIPDFVPSKGLFVNGNFDPFSRTRVMRRMELAGVRGNPTGIFNNDIPPSLGELIATIFSSLASVEICSDSLFASYNSKKLSSYYKFNEENSDVEKFQGAGIWAIIKVLQDESIIKRRCIDASIDYHQGSLLLGLQKYCQSPWVELMGDTYGDQYYFLVRKPPFDYASFKALIDVAQNFGELYFVHGNRVISDNLNYDDQNAYCWYRISSSKVINNVTIDFASLFSIYPVVYFPEYNEIFGNRAYDINSNYIDGLDNQVNIAQAKEQNDFIKQQLLSDLRYLVESTAYLPFTRKGSITILGHKRIKRGTVFKYELTGEWFYVDQVSLGYSIVGNTIEATTTYIVSRGMIATSDDGKDLLPLYFNIINFKEGQEISAPIAIEKEEVKILKIYFDTDRFTIIDPSINVGVRLPSQITNYAVTDIPQLKDDDEQDLNKRRQLRKQAELEIDFLVDLIKNDKTVKIEIGGHTDKDGSAAYNLELSKKRARSIVDAIFSGLAKQLNQSIETISLTYHNQLTAVGYGATKPLSYIQDQNSASIKQINRRVEAKITRTVFENSQTQESNAPSIQWHVNQDIFNFFLKRKQWCKTIDTNILDKIGNPSPPRTDKIDIVDSNIHTTPFDIAIDLNIDGIA